MPRIPTYDQGQLRSSLVGVPEQDLSGAKLMETVAAGADQSLRSLNYMRYNLRSVEREQKRQNVAMAKADALFTHNTDFDTFVNQTKEQYANDPDTALKLVKERTASYTKDYSSQIQDPAVRSAVYAEGLTYVRGRYASMQNEWAGTQRIVANKAKFDSIGSRLIVEAGQNLPSGPALEDMNGNPVKTGTERPMSQEEFSQRLAQYDETAKSFEPIYGDKLGEEVRETKAKATSSYLRNLAYTDPNLALKLLEDPEFSRNLTGKEKDAERDDIKTEIRAAEQIVLERQKVEQASGTVQLTQELADLKASGETDPRPYQNIVTRAKEMNLPTHVQTTLINQSVTAPKAATKEATAAREKSERLAKQEEKAATSKLRSEANAATVDANVNLRSTLATPFPKKGPARLEYLENLQTNIANAHAAQIKHMDANNGLKDSSLATTINRGMATVVVYGMKKNPAYPSYAHWEAKIMPKSIAGNTSTEGMRKREYYADIIAQAFLNYVREGHDPRTPDNFARIQAGAAAAMRNRYGR